VSLAVNPHEPQRKFAWGFLLGEQIPIELRANRDSLIRRAKMKDSYPKCIKKEIAQRVVTFLNRGEVDFLDKLGKDALFSTGIKLSRAKLICWLVDFLEKLAITGAGIKSEKDFDNRIMEVLGQSRVSPHQPREVK
jgi:hypothetical protein